MLNLPFHLPLQPSLSSKHLPEIFTYDARKQLHIIPYNEAVQHNQITRLVDGVNYFVP